jgi:glycosyltransferase involved in cell wall biosynthesis
MTAHNLESDIWRGYFIHEKNLLKKFYIYTQWKKMLRFERTAFQVFDGIIAVSEEEAARIRQMGGTNVRVVENGVDTRQFAPPGDPEEVDRIVFCGALDWRPNQDGVHYFLSEVFPRIRHLAPDCVFRIVGRRPPDTLVKAARSVAGVEMIGEVEDVRPHVAVAKVVVVPLRIGGGTRLKIVEAWSMQRAVVSTSVGASGLPVVSGKNIVLADTPEDFARGVTSLLRDPEMRGRIAQAGRAEALSTFDWTVLAEKQRCFWDEILLGFARDSPRD